MRTSSPRKPREFAAARPVVGSPPVEFEQRAEFLRRKARRLHGELQTAQQEGWARVNALKVGAPTDEVIEAVSYYIRRVGRQSQQLAFLLTELEEFKALEAESSRG